MITLTLADRSRGWLGELVVEEAPSSKLEGTGVGGPSARELARECRTSPGPARESLSALPAPDDCRIALKPLGETVAATWREINVNWPGVEALDLQVMPEHLHGIIHVVAPQSHPLGQIVGSFKARVMSKVKAALQEAPSSKLDGTGQVLAGASLWSPGLQDSILWTPLRRARATHYLRTNPYRLAIKRLFPWLFQVTRDLAINLGEGQIGHFSAIGNQFLLDAPEMVQIQCSRSFFRYRRDVRGNLLKDAPPEVESEEFREKWALASELASTGAVLVSPCISHGEREIARRAFRAGYQLITLANKGFSPLYKPGGRLFDQCAAGNLLMLAPVAWPYQPGEKKMTRVDALVLNEIAGWLVEGTPSSKLEGSGRTGGGRSPIDYRGARVENVAQLAAEAVALSNARAI